MNNFTAGQKKAIETLDRNLWVKAGAGAGKTRVLVERYIAILEQAAADVEGIVAITFTRKAAREMKERVRGRIRRLMVETAGSAEWQRWADVDRKMDSAPITTIHSLCSRILREHPAEAGVDPEFGLMEAADEISLLDETWRRVLDQAATRQEVWLANLLAIYTPNQVRQEFRALFEQLLAAGLIGTDLAAVLWPEAPDAALPARDKLKKAYLELFEWIPAGGKLTKTQATLAEIRAEWPQTENKIDAAMQDAALLDELDAALKGLRGSSEMNEAIQQRKAAAQEYRGAVLDLQLQRIVPDLCVWFCQAAEAWAQAKQQRGALTYDDLERGAEKLLRNHPAVCAQYVQRFRFLMVDECQDINERQRKIIYMLAGGQADRLQGKKLFAVGDGKQSIYRFRGADSQVFKRVEADVRRSGGEVVELLDNFRSHRDLVGAFNDFFLQLMPAGVCEEEADGADSVEYESLIGTRGAAEQAQVEMWVLDAKELQGQDARSQEAEMIAARILALVNDSQGSVRFRDIVVLLRAFTHVNLYEAAFAAVGIPYYVTGGRGFIARQEIADALALLRFLDNPYHEMALFATLRSPFFLLSDDTLLRLRLAGGEAGIWGGLSVAAAVDGLEPQQLAAAIQAEKLLSGWLARRGYLSPAQLLREAFAATGFDLLQLSQFMGDRRYANLLKLQDMALAFAESGGSSLAEFLLYIEQRAADEGEAEIDSEAGDTVRIMTIHKSKGLEFPVVIVPDLQRRFNLKKQLTVFLPDKGMGLKVPDARGKLWESARFRQISRRDHALEKAELKRLLYVAMTRAERQVVLSAVVDNPKTQKGFQTSTGWLDWTRNLFGLGGAVQEWPETLQIGNTQVKICRQDIGESVSALQMPGLALEPQAGLKPELPAQIRRNIEPVNVTTAKPRTLSPAYLAEYVSCPRRYFYAHICRLPGLQIRRGPESGEMAAGEPQANLAPQQLGIVFHRFLELMNPAASCEEALEQALTEIIPPAFWEEARRPLSRWVTNYVHSELYADVCSVAEDRREWPFQYRLLPAADQLPVVWLSGQIDRLLFYPDGTLGILDYKTDWVKPGQLQEKAAHYRLQIAGYALAAEAIMNRPVRDARLYFARLGEIVPVAVDRQSLDLARTELQSMAEFIRSQQQEADYVCRTEACELCPFQAVCLQE
jgi:ATP-dependent helicase/nuclease subunit A